MGSQARRSWMPDGQQTRLLRAALATGDDAVAAWNEWRRRADLSRLDTGSRRLLPMLDENLSRYDVDLPEGWRDVRAAAWRENEVLFFEAARMIDALRSAGIVAMTMKGAPLALLYYGDPSLRPMNDVDVLVRAGDARQAIALFLDRGWTPAYRDPETLVDFQHAIEFENADGFRCDLHWRVLAEGRQDVDDGVFWDAAVPTTLSGCETATLSATDQLLQVCVHAAPWAETPPVRWVADAITLLRNTTRIDWPRLIDLSDRHDVLPPVSEMLRYLHDVFGAPIPADVLKEVGGRRLSRRSRVRYFLFSHPARPVTRLANVHHWVESARLLPEPRLHRRAAALARFVWRVKLFPRAIEKPAR